MSWLDGAAAWLQPHLAQAVVLLAAVCLVLTGAVLSVAAANRRLTNHYRLLGADVTGGNLETLLDAHLSRVAAAQGAVTALQAELARLEERGRRAVQGVGLERYDAFEGVSGQVSFALALLDARGDGVLVNSVFGPERSATYAKAVRAGRALVPLTDEETAAVNAALGSAPRGRGAV